MPEEKPAISSRDAMSRALGAAFLSHQVETLEKTVNANSNHLGTSSNRRDWRSSPATDSAARGRGGPKRNGAPSRGQGRARGSDLDNTDDIHSQEGDKSSDGDDKDEKRDADLVIVDASVLVHAIGQVKKWCRSGREEIIVVPLEALNTLDLLKKGTTPIAQRARAASRILEQQVGTNPRIKVQRDDAFVLWDEIPFQSEGNGEDEAIELTSPQATPEWLRRTICCARWEHEHVPALKTTDTAPEAPTALTNPPRIMIAVSPTELEAPPVPADLPPVSSSPVPLPPSFASKYEQRASGTLVAYWAQKAGLAILDVKSTPLPLTPSAASVGNPGLVGRPRSTPGQGRGSSDNEWRGGPGTRMKSGSVGRKNMHSTGSYAHMSDKGNTYSLRLGVPGRGGGDKLVERPAATMAMNASIMQPNKVVRVLARGEKLEP